MSTDSLTWFKSSHSDGEGGDCLEVAYDWRKSSHSSGEGGQCLEVALTPHTIHIRDSKNPTGARLTLSPTTWSAFLPSVQPLHHPREVPQDRCSA